MSDVRHIAYPRLFAAACVLAIGAVAATYANSLDNAFQFDDAHVVEENLYIRNLGNVPRFFTDATTFSSLTANATYRPLVTTTLAIDYRLAGGLVPRQFHITQLVLLVVMGVLLVPVFARTFSAVRPDGWNAWAALGAVLWVIVHTANTQTANYISARSEIISAIGVAGAFVLYQFAPWSRRFHLYLVPMVIGALGKVSAVIFAPLLLAYVLGIEARLSVRDLIAPATRGRALRAAGRALPAFAVGIATFVFVESMNAEGASYGGGDRLSYAMTQLYVWLHYARLFVFPIGLTGDTDWDLIPQWYDTRVIAGALFVAVLLAGIWRASRSDAWRPVAFGLVWFAAALLPSSSLFPLAEVANEHRIFAPYMGCTLAVAWVVLEASRRRRSAGRSAVVIGVAFVAVIAANAVGARQRNLVWRTDETFWYDVVQKSPANGRAHMNYGLSQMRRARYDAAQASFDRAAQMLPNYSTLEINRAIVTSRLGDQQAAERLFLRAQELQPNSANAHLFYARWMTERDRAPDAIPLLRRTIELSAASISARTLLMKVYYAAGDDAAVAALADETHRIAPDEPVAAAFAAGGVPLTAPDTSAQGWFNAGLAYTNQGNHLDAALAYRQALRRAPDNPDYHNNLAWSRAKLGFYDLAVAGFSEALRLRPGDVLARNNLAWVRAEQAARR